MNRGAKLDPIVTCISDLEREGSKKLSKTVRDYYNEGAMDLITLKESTAGYDRLRLRPRVCADVSNIDLSTECFGVRVSMPLGFSPTAMHRMAHEDGEIATSRAAAKNGINMILSTWSNSSVADVVAQGQGNNAYGMQLSMVEDNEMNMTIVRAAERAGCKTLVLTVDCAVLGRRLNEYRNDFELPTHLTFPNLPGVNAHDSAAYDPKKAYDRAFTWEKVRQLVNATTMEVYCKGVLTAEDAVLAAEAGAAGVIVSNHGGRQLDSGITSLDALPEVVDAVKGRIKVHIDGGIRRGSDIFKALALGADHCWVGRIPIWGLSYNGEQGVDLAVQILRDELLTTMALCGCAKISDIKRSHLARLRPDGIMARL